MARGLRARGGEGGSLKQPKHGSRQSKQHVCRTSPSHLPTEGPGFLRGPAQGCSTVGSQPTNQPTNTQSRRQYVSHTACNLRRTGKGVRCGARERAEPTPAQTLHSLTMCGRSYLSRSVDPFSIDSSPTMSIPKQAANKELALCWPVLGEPAG